MTDFHSYLSTETRSLPRFSKGALTAAAKAGLVVFLTFFALPALAGNCRPRAHVQAQLSSNHFFLEIQNMVVNERLAASHESDEGSRDFGRNSTSDLVVNSIPSTSPDGASGNAATAQSMGFNRSFTGQGYTIWSNGFASYGREKNVDGGVDNFSRFAGTLGFDKRFSPSFLAGVALGFGSGNTTIGTDGSRVRASSFSGAVYGSLKIAPQTFIDAVAGYAGGPVETRRANPLDDTIVFGTRDASNIFGSLALTRNFMIGDVKFAAFVRGEAYNMSLSNYSEQGSSTALSYGKLSTNAFKGVVGLRADYPISMSWGVLSFRPNISYHHAFAGDFSQRLAFVTPGIGAILPVSGTMTKTDEYVGGIDLRARMDQGLDLFIGYQHGVTRHGDQTRTMRGGVSARF